MPSDEPRRTGIRAAIGAVVVLAVILLAWFASPRDSALATADAEPDDPTSLLSGLARPRSDARATAKLDLRSAPKAGIRGSVRDPIGDPIADAQVCALSNDEARHGVPDRALHCVRSDREGRYAIDDLLPIATAVHASAASFQPARWELRERGITRSTLPLRAGQTTADIDLVLEPGGVLIRGVVKDIAGGEIEGAQVTVSGSWGSKSPGAAVTISGADGRFEQWVAPGSISVLGRAEGYARGWVGGVAPSEQIELYLTPESIIVGTVVTASTGEPVEGVEVSAYGFGGVGSAVSDVDGRFRLDQLQPGSYDVTARGDEIYGEAVGQVHVGLGETSDPIVVRVHPAVRVEGEVKVAGGSETDRMCPGGRVVLRSREAGDARADIDHAGHVEFRGVLPGTYEVSVECRNHLEDEDVPDLIVADHSLLDLVWEVREGLAIRGEVVDEAGQPVAKVNLSVRAVVDPDAARTRTSGARGDSEADGSFELGGLLPGRYEVSSDSWRGRPGPRDPVVVELTSGADVNDVRLVMPAIGSIHGRIVDELGEPVAGASLQVWQVGERGQASATSDELGKFVIDEVRTGPTRVKAGKGRFGRTDLRRPGTTDDDIQGELVEVVANEIAEVTLTVEAQSGRITGVVRDEGGAPVADAFIDVERMSDSAGASAAAARQSVRWSWGSQPVLTDDDGSFTLDGLPDGSFIVRANRKGGGEAVAEGVGLGDRVELVIASTGTVSGTVRDADGHAPERFSVRLSDKSQAISVGDSFFRTDGVWRLTEVPAGSYEVSANAIVGAVTLDDPVELGEGEQLDGVALVLTGRVRVRGRVVDLETGEPVPGISVVLGGPNRLPFYGDDKDHLNVSDSDGRFELDDVQAGQVQLYARPRAGGREAKYDVLSKSTTLASEPAVQDIGELELVPRRLDPDQTAGDLGFTTAQWDRATPIDQFEFVVALVRPDGPAAGSGLAAGDVIEQVDGHDVRAEHNGRYRALTQVPEGTKLTLTVTGGKTVEIVVAAPIR